jgi:predicted RND superfamily exporter protein
VVLAVYRDPDLLDESRRGVERLARISEALEQTPGVRGVLSLAQLDSSLQKMASTASLFGLSSVPELGIVQSDSDLSQRFLRLFQGYTHGADGSTAAVVCMLQPIETAGVSRRETIDQLRQTLLEKLEIEGLAGGQITGEPVMIVDGFRYIEEDGQRLGVGCTILLSLTILLCFRSVRWVLISVGVVQLALLLTRGVLVWSGLRLSMVSSMLTAIVTVVGIATVVHIIVRFREGRRQGLLPHEALTRTVVLLAAPVFWACTTDAVGFASLLVADVTPVRDFGLMMAIGSMMVLVSVVLVVPALTLAGWHPGRQRPLWGEQLLANRLSGVLNLVQRHPLAIAILATVFFAVTAAGAYRLEIETDFTRTFRAGSPIVRAYDTVETNLGGAGVWDVVLPAPETLNWTYLVKVLKLEQRLRDEVAVAGQDDSPQPAIKVLSMADAVVAGAPSLLRTRSRLRRTIILSGAVASLTAHMPVVGESLHGKDPEAAQAAELTQTQTAEEPSRVQSGDGSAGESADATGDEPAAEPGDASAASGPWYFRIMLRAVERQPAEQKRALIDQVTKVSREEFPEAEVTGFFVLLTNLISSIIRDQWLTFAVAMGGIGVTMCLAFLRPHYALIALVPNALPILTVTGLMGWLGLKINMGAAMIAAVSMGLSVDSSIHYLSSFLRARRSGFSVADSLAEVQQTVGRAMTFSTLALIIGFSVLATSNFVPTIYFGTLVSLTMLGGLLGNLIVLPLLLRLVSHQQPTSDL